VGIFLLQATQGLPFYKKQQLPIYLFQFLIPKLNLQATPSHITLTLKPIQSNTALANLLDWIDFFDTRYQKTGDWIALEIQ
jgi:hypothetical protein